MRNEQKRLPEVENIVIYSLYRNKINYCNIKRYFYVDISKKKESSANYSGDGPSTSVAMTIENSNQSLILNGITLHRSRKNVNYKIVALNKALLESRIGRSNTTYDISIGDIVISINEISIFNLHQSQVTEMLSYYPVHSIESYGHNEWRRQCRNRRIPATDDYPSSQENRNGMRIENNHVPNGIDQNHVTLLNERRLRQIINNNSNLSDLNLLWDYENKCKHCGCLYLTTEKNRIACCNNGNFMSNSTLFPKLKPLPPQLKNLIINRLAHFGRNSVSYNNILSLGATGVDNGSSNNGWELIHGNHCVTLHGRTYHFITTSDGSNGLHYFLFDAQLELLGHGDKLNVGPTGDIEYKRIYPEYLRTLFLELQHINVLVQEVERIGQFSLNPNTDITSSNILVDLNTRTSYFDVAAITSNDVKGNRILTIRRKGSTTTSTIGTTDSKLEPLSYPLLFPYGEDGWGEHIRKNIKFPQYILSRLLMGEKNEDGSRLVLLNRENKEISVNRFQIMSRLAQTYLVDNISRAIDYRLNWHKNHQQDIFGINDINELINDNDNDNNNNEGTDHTFLSQSCHGSRRHLRRLSSNALAIVSEYGRPSIFITLTCNSNWKNITDQLLDSQVSYGII